MDDLQDAQFTYLNEMQQHALAMVGLAMKAAKNAGGNVDTAISMLANLFTMQVAALEDVVAARGGEGGEDENRGTR